MPVIHQLGAIRILVYSRDHAPPHVHAVVAEYEALIEIKTLKVIAGHLPKRQLQTVIRWARQPHNNQRLLETFHVLNPVKRK